MHPLPFSYHKATTLENALQLLQEHADDAKILGGGQSLLPVMKLRLASPAHLIDISGIEGLAGIAAADNGWKIGALTTHAELAASEVPLFSEMAHVVGDSQVRNLGTIGGALAHADPAADYPAGALALNVELDISGPDGQRTVSIHEFFVGFMTTSLEPNEIVTAIRIPELPGDVGVSYQKLANPASGYATAGVAAVISKNDGAISYASIGITGASDVAYRATEVEQALVGSDGSDDAIRSAAAHAVGDRDLLSDVQASADYRAKVVPNLVFRAVKTALGS